ncbi:hypothetical protein [Micromonospora palomenae]|uniref:hypothetical protein n=1 Tax=Micromonospora palomenae TaxID=1461247 RepID=UPI003F8A1E0F
MGEDGVLSVRRRSILPVKPDRSTDWKLPVKRGFLIMPFSGDLEWVREEIVAAGLRAGVDFERADDIFTPGVILDQILKAIDDADAIVAVCTGKNPNVFFELGYAIQRHSPILVAEDTDDLPFDIRHLRTELYGRAEPGGHKKTLQARLVKAITAALEEKPVPRGFRLASAPKPKLVARIDGRLERTGKGHRLTLTNAGTAELRDVDVAIPEEAQSFHLFAADLPIGVLRPGEQVRIPASVVMGGGPSIFDVTVKGVTPEGEHVDFPVKISL